MKTFTITDADAEKLAALVRENVEYRPDYFGSLAAAVLGQFEEQAECPEYGEERSQ